MLNKQCAPSSSPVRILSLTLAQDASFVTSTFTPYLSKSPSSLAITRGAQSVSGIYPRRITSFSGLAPGSTSSNGSSIQRSDFFIFIFIFFMMWKALVFNQELRFDRDHQVGPIGCVIRIAHIFYFGG